MPTSPINLKKTPFQTWILTQADESHLPIRSAGTVAYISGLAHEPPRQTGLRQRGVLSPYVRGWSAFSCKAILLYYRYYQQAAHRL